MARARGVRGRSQRSKPTRASSTSRSRPGTRTAACDSRRTSASVRPAQLSRARGTLFYDVNNRGGPTCFNMFGGGSDPYFLARQGFVVVVSGWIAELLPDGRKYVLRAAGRHGRGPRDHRSRSSRDVAQSRCVAALDRSLGWPRILRADGTRRTYGDAHVATSREGRARADSAGSVAPRERMGRDRTASDPSCRASSWCCPEDFVRATSTS